jgi:pimeloyl-ACP methyl ester carboxylesterase
MHRSLSPAAAAAQARRPRRRWIARLARGLLWVLVVLVGLSAIGAAYQAIATANDARANPPPGQMVDLGGYRVHVYSQGASSSGPTVVLLGCGGCTLANWGWVQPEVAQFARVVAYERAGFGWSEPGPAPRDAAQNARELHAALERAGIPGPYVVVGHSYGGPVARVFAAQYPADVVGMVLLDPRHPDQDARFPAEANAAAKSEEQLIAMLGWMARFGLLRLSGIGQEQARELSPEWQASYVAAYNSVQYWTSLGEQARDIAATDAEVRRTGSLGALPLIVVSASTAWLTPGAPADAARQVYTQMNAEQAALSSNSLHRIVEGATHTSLVNDRHTAQLVAAMIRQVVEAARSGKPLAK